MLSACAQGDVDAGDPSRVLQNVTVNLTPSASITGIHGTTISMDSASGQTTSDTRNYSVRDVVDQLPVRVSTRYKTSDSSGADLADLAGHNGPVTIDVTVENLSLEPRALSYDVGGVSRMSNAMVGVPLTVAGSASLKDVDPSRIVRSTADASFGTNGVVSVDANGNSQVQWAAILSAPTSAASTTMRLEVDAQDFSVPNIQIAVQPGITTDMSAAGAVTDAFSEGSTEMKLLRRTIGVVDELNDLMGQAGGSVQEVRDSLNGTSTSLSQGAATDIRDTAERLSGRMTDLGDEVRQLKVDLDQQANSGTEQSTVTSQLMTTVEAVERSLGDTSAQPKLLEVGANRCVASAPASEGSAHANTVQFSRVMGAFAAAEGDCRTQLTGVIKDLLGPAEPTRERCTSGSLTCSLFLGSVTTQAALIGLVATYHETVETLQPQFMKGALNDFSDLDRRLRELEKQVAQEAPGQAGPEPATAPSAPGAPEADTTNDTPAGTGKDMATLLQAADQGAQRVRDQLSAMRKDLDEVHSTAVSAREKIREGSGSMLEQNRQLADELCALDGGTDPGPGQLSEDTVKSLRSYLSDTDCAFSAEPSPMSTEAAAASSRHAAGFAAVTVVDTTPAPESSPSATDAPTSAPESSSTAPAPTPTPSVTTTPVPETSAPGGPSTQGPDGFEGSMEDRLRDQAAKWEDVARLTDTSQPDGALGKRLGTAEKGLQDVMDRLERVRRELGVPEGGDSSPAPSPSASPSSSPGSPSEGPSATPQPTDQPSARPITGPSNKADSPLTDAVRNVRTATDDLGDALKELGEDQAKLESTVDKVSGEQAAHEITKLMEREVRRVNGQSAQSVEALDLALSRGAMTGLQGSSGSGSQDQQAADLERRIAQYQESMAARTRDALATVSASSSGAVRDLDGASALLNADLGRLVLDLGDQDVRGSGILGALSTNAAKAGNADYQLALASEFASSYANLRSDDIAGVRLRQAQTTASLEAMNSLPPFAMQVDQGTEVAMLYSFHVGDEG